MDGQGDPSDLRRVLVQCGVAGPILADLAASPLLTADAVRREWRTITADPHVRKPTSVLVSRLAKVCGIDIRRTRWTAGKGRDIDDFLKKKRANLGMPERPVARRAGNG